MDPTRTEAAPVAFTFPGQGSQQVGAWQELGAQSERGRERLAEAESVLGLELERVLLEGPAEELARTELAQPCLLVMDVVCAERIQARGFSPAVVLGHSLGEYAALVVAGSLTFADAVALVRHRGELMAQASEKIPGTMAAVIGAEQDRIVELVNETRGDHVVELSNVNAPKQLVLSGEVEGVRRCMEAIREARLGRAVELAVSAPFHCSLMRPVADRFAERLADVALRPPRRTFVDNVTGAVESDPERIRAKLVEQIYRPVQWQDAVAAAYAEGARTFVECGPGKVLTNLVKRIARDTERLTAQQLLHPS